MRGVVLVLVVVLAAGNLAAPPVAVIRHEPGTAEAALRTALPAGRPALPGFRPSALDPRPVPTMPPDAPPALRRAADVVGARLARDGWPRTFAAALQILGPDADRATLERAGLPVDLEPFFRAPDGTRLRAWIADRLASGETPASLATSLATAPFEFVATEPAFAVATESGEHAIGTLRLQLTRGDDWQAPGDGGSVDLLRQLAVVAPDASLLVSIQARFLDELLVTAEAWPLGPVGRTTIVTDPGVVSQWAQDNGKAGRTTDDGVIATLAPRFASRRDDGSEFVPNESMLLAGLAVAGHRVIESPLLFQGGNLLAVRHPATGERLLLVGEAEVHRNVALGLTPDQVLDAFRIEFGVDRCAVLPAVSFHIDYDVTVRAVGDELVAFVNDTATGVAIVLRRGLEALERAGALDAETAAQARLLLKGGHVGGVVPIVATVLERQVGPRGEFPLSFANAFAVDPADSAVGNFRRFLLAWEMAAAPGSDPGLAPSAHAGAYLASLRARPAREAMLHDRLRELGFRVVPVPGIAEAEESLVAVNGLHDRTRYFMSATGGFYAALDDAARAVFERELGPGVRVVPIRTAESQRRVGALHCSVAAFPAPPQ